MGVVVLFFQLSKVQHSSPPPSSEAEGSPLSVKYIGMKQGSALSPPVPILPHFKQPLSRALMLEKENLIRVPLHIVAGQAELFKLRDPLYTCLY